MEYWTWRGTTSACSLLFFFVLRHMQLLAGADTWTGVRCKGGEGWVEVGRWGFAIWEGEMGIGKKKNKTIT